MRLASTIAAALCASGIAMPAGAALKLGLTSGALDFGAQSIHTTTPARTITITNTGAATVSVGSVTATRDFAVTHNCASIAAGASCAAFATFTPSVQGTVAGTLTLQSSEGTQAVQLTGTGERSLVTHYYRSILRRAPDDAGKAFWDAEAARLAPLGANVNEVWFAMALQFYGSSEYAAFRRDEAGFVTDLYTTFFNREPDAAGRTYWTGLLASGMPREVALAAFMFSPEFASFTRAIFGDTAARAEVDMVIDFYRGLLGRLPDSDGFASWLRRLRAAQCAGRAEVVATVESISSAFGTSPEYTARNRSDPQYVGDLYNSFLRRGGDLEGVKFWIAQLASGARTREQLRREFIASPEFQARVAAVIAQGCQSTASGNFTFTTATAVGPPSGNATVHIQRTGGSAGAYDLYYSLFGEGCTGRDTYGPVKFGDGDATTKAVSIPLAASGVCTALLTVPSAVIGGQRSVAITAVPVVAGCPAPQTNIVFATLGGLGNPLLQRQRSGQMLFMDLPAVTPGRASGVVIFSESAGGAYTPQPVTIEISIGKCPGVIDTDTANACNLRSTNGHYNSITWLVREVQGINAGNASRYGYCWAGDGGRYFVNARWTYTTCAFGVETCGFAIQRNDGSF